MSEPSIPTLDEHPKQRGFASAEIIGELILLALVAGFFIYIVVSSFEWSLGAKCVPLIAVTLGAPFLVYRLYRVIRVALSGQGEARGQIMDFGFRSSGDAKGERRRFVRIFAAIGILYLGIWVLGFHIMIPLWVFCYMWLYSGVRKIWAAVAALILLGVLYGLYDTVLAATWPDPLIKSWF
jgi:hypothetical protein